MIHLLDHSLILTALTPLLTAKTVRDLRQLGNQQRQQGGLLVEALPGLVLIPAETTPTRTGLTHSGVVIELFDLVIQVDESAKLNPNQHLNSLRTAVLAALEPYPMPPPWTPIRYQGGQSLTVDNTLITWVERYRTTAPFSGA